MSDQNISKLPANPASAKIPPHLWHQCLQRKHDLLVVHLAADLVTTIDRQITQCARTLDDDLVDVIRQTLYQATDDVFPLQESSSGRIVLDHVGHGGAGPSAFRCVSRLKLQKTG